MELVGEHGYDTTTLGDIADRADSGARPDLVLLPRQAPAGAVAVHRLMHRTWRRRWAGEPRTAEGPGGWRGPSTRSWAWRDRPVLMRQHMAGLLQAGWVSCPVRSSGGWRSCRATPWPGTAHRTSTATPMLRALLMGAVFAALVPGVPMPRAGAPRRVVQALPAGVGDGCPPDARRPTGRRATRICRGSSRPECPVGRPGPTGPTVLTGRLSRSSPAGSRVLSSRRWTRPWSGAPVAELQDVEALGDVVR